MCSGTGQGQARGSAGTLGSAGAGQVGPTAQKALVEAGTVSGLGLH